MTDLSPVFPSGVVGESVSRGQPSSAPPPAPSDQEIITLTLAGRREAFETLVLRYERPIYAHLLHLTGRAEDAEDLAQETFLKAYRGLAGYRPEFPFRAWLYRIATNTAISALRRRGPVMIPLDGQKDGAPPLEIADPAADSPAERLAREEMAAQLERAVAALPPEAAALINLRYREGMSLEEIGAALGRKPGAVAVTVHRLRQRLRQMIFG